MRAAHVIETIQTQPWAITTDGLRTVLAIAHRETDIRAVEAQLGRPLDNTRTVAVRNGVAIVPITGTIFRRANLFSAISGGANVETLARDITTALADPSVHSIVLDIDSPGGEVTGISELSGLIRDGNARKPIIAYGDGLVASAAYWAASGAGEIVVSETAIVGSIGIVMTVADPNATTSKDIEIVSSQSPNKRPNVATEGGRAIIQNHVDTLADVFIQNVATNRGIDAETVATDYGQGDVLVGQKAVDAGLADRIGTMEGVIAELIARHAQVKQRPQGGHFRGGLMGGNEKGTELIAQTGGQVADPDVEQMKTKMAALEASLEASQRDLVAQKASAWASEAVASFKLTPGEKAQAEALYIILANDDRTTPLASGQTSRVDVLKAFISDRTPNAAGMGERVPQGAVTVLAPSRGPQEPTADDKEARKRALNNKTATGRALNKRRV